MELTIYEQTGVFLWSFLIGVILAAVYTVFAVLRELSPPGRVLLFLSDVLFTAIAAAVNFVFALSQTHGKIRGYSLLAQAAAFFLLYLTAGRFIKHSAGRIRDAFQRAVGRISAPVFKAVRGAEAVFCGKCQKLLKKIKK